MSIEARQIQETLYSYAAILNFTPSLQGLRAKFGACSVQNAQLLLERIMFIVQYNNVQRKRGYLVYYSSIGVAYPDWLFMYFMIFNFDIC